MSVKTIYSFFLSVLVVVSLSCAYFNTFYNAEQYFAKAEQARLEKMGENLPASAIDAYAKVIEKSNRVLEKYPNTKYRIRALLLIGMSRFHRQEYRLAVNIFKQLYQEGNAHEQSEATYWLALCKWKLGKPQPALDDLHGLLEATDDDQFRSKIYLSIAEINLDLNNDREALNSLEKAAGFTRERSEKGQIYYRLSELAFARKDYPRALMAYKNVLKNSSSKKRIEEANLQIVRVYRLMGDFKTASNRIKNMLVDESFSAIYGDLELELAKMYFIQELNDNAVTRLESITLDYPKTPTSAEAYYLLGEYMLLTDWDLENARKYHAQVSKESRTSPFAKSSQKRIKEIDQYLSAEEQAQNLREQLENMVAALLDTSATDTVDTEPIDISKIEGDIAAALYSLSELEAFHFERGDLAMDHLTEIINDYPNSVLRPKAMFTLSYLLEENDDSLKADRYQRQILSEYPKSDFADYIRNKKNLAVEESASARLLRKAEQLWYMDPLSALNNYKTILKGDSTSESSARAAYFLAYQYDRLYQEPDSALKYYEWLLKYQPESEQGRSAKKQIDFLQSLLVATQADTGDTLR